MNVAEYIVDYLSKIGVTHVFGVSGGMIMWLIDAVYKHPKIEFIHLLHEQSAVVAADAYAQLTGELGVVFVTSGPGATNAITGVAASYTDSTPLLIISGQCKTADIKTNERSRGCQEVDIISMVKGITKYAERVDFNVHTINQYMYLSTLIAMDGRKGTAWLDIPLDLQGMDVDEKGFLEIITNPNKDNQPPQVQNVINLLKESKKPVILAGHGIKAAKAEKDFLELVDHLKIPVMTTWRGMDLLEDDHYMYFGRPGLLGSQLSEYVEENCDLLICIGARMDMMQTSWEPKNYAHQAKKVVIDIDQAELDKLPDNYMKICCDAKSFINSLKEIDIDSQTDDFYEDWCNKLVPIRDKKTPHIKYDYVNMYDFVDVLSDLAQEYDIIVPSSSGFASEIVQQAWRVKKGQKIICNPGLGSMGFALPHAIGACIASGGQRVICIEGDGSLQHNIQELQTIARLKLPIKIFVINNNGYASIRNTHQKFFGNNPIKDLSFSYSIPNGIHYENVTKNINMFYRIEELVLKLNCPVICNVIIDPDQKKELI